MIYTIALIATILFFIIMLMIDNRNSWNPPIRGIGTPKIVKDKTSGPFALQGRPVVIHKRSVHSHVDEEIEDFHDFLKNANGSVIVRKGKIPIARTEGRLLAWSYRPFREGFWNDFIISGLRDPAKPYWFGVPSLIPNPRNHIVESPMTLVSAEEEILRFIGGGATIRIFSSAQPTFPKFTPTEHGDVLTDTIHHKIKGEELKVSDGMVIAIPRGWAYRIHLDPECIAVLRIPVLSPISWVHQLIQKLRYSFVVQRQRPKEIKHKEIIKHGSDNASYESESEEGDD
jgi:hypothetical protein